MQRHNQEQKLHIYGFGTAPEAAKLGYSIREVVVGTEDDIKSKFSGDLIAVKGAAIFGQDGQNEWAIMSPTGRKLSDVAIAISDVTRRPAGYSVKNPPVELELISFVLKCGNEPPETLTDIPFQRGTTEDQLIQWVKGSADERKSAETERRYVVGGWSHIFGAASANDRSCRIVFDRQANKLAYLEIENGIRGWVPATETERLDVEDSLKNANDEAISSPQDWGLEASDSLPAWVHPDRKLCRNLDCGSDLEGRNSWDGLCYDCALDAGLVDQHVPGERNVSTRPINVTLPWNPSDSSEGEYATTVWAVDDESALQLAAEEMADSGEKSFDSAEEKAEYVRELVADGGHIVDALDDLKYNLGVVFGNELFPDGITRDISSQVLAQILRENRDRLVVKPRSGTSCGRM